jgi:hypothetical protein
MTISEPNPLVRPTGAEAGEFIDPSRDEDEDHEVDPTARPTGSLPVEPANTAGGSEDVDLSDDPEARRYTSEPLKAEDGSTYVIQRQNVGPGNELGGGEWPDPATPPRPPAPGAA